MTMYIDENDNRTPRERIDDSFLRRMLGEEKQSRDVSRGGNGSAKKLPCNPDGGRVNERLLVGFPLGMVYAPYQEWKKVYDVETALSRGTLFPELDKPWEIPAPTGKGGRCCDE